MHLENPRSLPAARPRAAFTLMEILVVVSIILVLGAIAMPVYTSMRSRANQVVAVNNMRQITAALITYAGQNDGDFPDEGITQGSSWANAASPLGDKVWYNVLPRLSGNKGLADYANTPGRYYTKENLLFLPGAKYPVEQIRLPRPFFAFAINTKLQRKSRTTGQKAKAKMSQIVFPARTVVFLEEGMPGEDRPSAIQWAYAGDSKAAGRNFVERYNGKGVMTFMDGHAEALETKTILTATGLLVTPDKNNIYWTRTPEEDVNNPPP